MLKKGLVFIALFWALLVLGSASCASKPEEAPLPPPPKTFDHSGNCRDYAEISFSDFIIQNNTWNNKGIKDYEECIYGPKEGTDISFGWRWYWPAVNDQVKAYPEIIYGHKPWSSSSTAAFLPRPLSAITGLTAAYDIAQQAAGSYNLAFDIWLNQALPPKPQNITREIMIWLDYRVMKPAGKFREKVSIDGEEYDFYMGDVNTGKWTYIAFIKKNSEFSGDTKLHLFFKYLVEKGHVSSAEYCSSVEFGNELVSGGGKTDFTKYTITAE